MDRARRIARIGRLASPGCVALAALPFLAVPAVWSSGGAPLDLVAPGPAPSAPFAALAALAALTPAVPAAWGLLRLRRFFRRLAGGEILSAAGARDLRAFGAALVVRAALAPAAGAAASVAATWERGPGARALAIRLSDADLGLLLVAALAFAAALALAEAAEIAEERALIV